MRQSVRAKKVKASAIMETKTRAKEIGATQETGTWGAKEIGVRAVKDGFPKDGATETEAREENPLEDQGRLRDR